MDLSKWKISCQREELSRKGDSLTDEIGLRESKIGAKVSILHGSDFLEDFGCSGKEIINDIYPQYERWETI